MTEGARTELERVYRESGERLWRAVLLFSGDREIASDAVAEAFAQALRRGDAIRSPDRWVWRTAFLVARGMLKERRRTIAKVPDRGYQMSPGMTELVDALRALSPTQRAAVVLHYYADRSVREVATLLGSTPAAVSVHLHRARRRLRTLLEGRDD
ncbi:MAG TPA: sigma-70 family RNA polymerase sigma factor [Actinomycetota bacterium]|nr:sigma-70 family RNA polymerase sigma factor [Actinomycetota bacterium]